MKSFLRTVDDSDLTMGSGTFGGIGSGNGVTPPATPRTTLCIPDGPAACVVYELALDGSGNTTGAPAMDEQGDSTRQTTWRPFLSEPATLLHVVNGSRDAAATLAPGYGEEGGSVGPLAVNVPDAVDEAHWYVKPVASLPGHTPATSGGPGLPHAPLYVCSGFNRKHGTGDDRTTAPPDAYPLPVASAPGGGDPGSSDGESKASTGPCACSLGNPSVANAASTTDPGLGVMLPGYVDPIMASVLPVGPGGVQVLGGGLVWPWDPDADWGASPEDWAKAASETVKSATGGAVDPAAAAIDMAQKWTQVANIVSLLNNIRSKVWGKYGEDGAAIIERLWKVISDPFGTWQEDFENITKFFSTIGQVIDAFKADPEGCAGSLADLAEDELVQFIEALTSDDEEKKAEAWAEVFKMLGDIAIGVATAGAGSAATGAKVAAGGVAAAKAAAKAASNGAKKLGSIYEKAIALLRTLLGQKHHVLSKKIKDALAKHSNLKGVIEKWKKVTTQAATPCGHKGYQKWHRDYDEKVVKWLRDTPDATQDLFKEFLEKLYSEPEMKKRFPNGIKLE